MALASPSRIVEALRDYGVTVVERDGWRSRSTGFPFEPFGQAFHHDALSESASDARALQMMEEGRSDLRGPLCNGWIDSSSVVYLVAYGNANHAGRNEADVIDRLRHGLAPLGDARDDPDGDTVIGNTVLWGWECRNAGDGTDVWDQLAAMERSAAALADACGWPTEAIVAHRELTARKPDPRGIDMHQFRADVALILNPQGDDMPLTEQENADLQACKYGISRLEGVTEALKQSLSRIETMVGDPTAGIKAEVLRTKLAVLGLDVPDIDVAALADEIADALPAERAEELAEQLAAILGRKLTA